MNVLRGRLLFGWEPMRATNVGEPSKGLPTLEL